MGKTRKIQRQRMGKVQKIDQVDQDRRNKRKRVSFHLAQRRLRK